MTVRGQAPRKFFSLGAYFGKPCFLTRMILHTAKHKSKHSIFASMAPVVLKDIGVGDGSLPNTVY